MALNSSIAAPGGLTGLLRGAMSREELFAALCILSCVNGLAGPAIDQVARLGWFAALLDTFGMSIIVLVACCLGVGLILREKTSEIRSADVPVAAATLVLILLPVAAASWVALTALSIYLLLSADKGSPLMRGGLILLATTFPMLWSRLLFLMFSRLILQIDASLVGWILDTQRIGNMVRFIDDSGYLVVFPGCSSLNSTSMAFLCWIVVSQAFRHRWASTDIFWCALACGSVVAINVARMSLMAISTWHFHVFHNEVSAAIANTLALVLALGFSVLGSRRDVFSRI